MQQKHRERAVKVAEQFKQNHPQVTWELPFEQCSYRVKGRVDTEGTTIFDLKHFCVVYVCWLDGSPDEDVFRYPDPCTRGNLADSCEVIRNVLMGKYTPLAPKPARAAGAIAHVTRKPGIYTDLPRVLYIEGIDDAGEYGNAACPHCGALGRYTVIFVTEDGKRAGAMKGCFSKFPQHRFCPIMISLMEKEREYKDRGWNLPTWDKTKMQAIWDFANGKIPEYEADARIKSASRQAANYRKSRGWR